MNLGEWYFTQNVYTKLINIIKVNEIVLLIILLGLIIMLLFIIDQKRKDFLKVLAMVIANINSLRVLSFIRNRIFKGDQDFPAFFKGKEYMYYLGRMEASGLFLIFCFNAFFVACIIYVFIKKILKCI